MNKSAEEQISDLQSQLTFQEDELEKMNDALYQQQLRMDALQQQMKKLENQIEALAQEPASGSSLADEKPPHY